MIFRALPLRFEFEAKSAVSFAPGQAANTFRGALGLALDRAAHARFFAPHGDGSGPSGFEDRPRPYVLRAAALDGRRFQAGDRLTLDVNVFDLAAPALEAFREAFERLEPRHGRIQLIEARQADAVEIDLAKGEPAAAVLVRFLTPMELKFAGAVLREPRFEALFARVRDRVSTLCSLYQSGAPDVDYRALGERSRLIVNGALRIEQVKTERRSSRTRQRHGLGGFIGEAEYTGQLGEFLPWLKAAEWTGAGRLTVWGNGALLAGVSGDRVAAQRDAGSRCDAVLRDSES